MKPIYFPFTYVSAPVAEALSACFGQFVIYQPLNDALSEQMQLLKNRGLIEIRVPVNDDDMELKTAVKNYQIWADLHRTGPGAQKAIMKMQRDVVPFFSDLSSSKIVEDIKAKSHNPANTQIPDPVPAARIFLYFAQEFDRWNQELSDGFNHYQSEEAEMIRQLKSEADPVAGEFRAAARQLPEPFGDYMISDRLQAWTRIFYRDPEAFGLFVTHSPAVMTHLLDRTSTAVRVMPIQSIPLSKMMSAERDSRQKKLVSNLARLVEHKPTDSTVDWGESIERLDWPAAENTVSLSIYLVPDQTPDDFFSRCTGIKRTGGAGRPHEVKNTLIALIQKKLENTGKNVKKA